MGKPLSERELHNLAMNIVGRELESEGYDFMGVNSEPKRNPQFVCLKDKILHFIVVRYVPHPENPNIYDQALMKKMKDHADKHEAKTYYAGVGLSNAENPELPVYLNEAYVVDYIGLIEIKDE
ncbi:Na(+)-translocating NADH-quinone reductase subunit F [Zobellia alginiliquefaciens]|uniref:Na(+)-translocating NADH-quinone reductase subunit F n=1 Tax=Zobellia alginiliquefaciens TaxID=3032586 RepID=UPI0023E390B8|nr:Na(+)-translocating NADH-quinone reductase subunit F [Zobellia alginiliquefaciens]